MARKRKINSGCPKGGIRGRKYHYQKIAKRGDELIERLFELLYSKNEGVAVSAAKTLLNKMLPDLKALEVSGDQDEPLGVVVLPPQYEEKESDSNKTDAV